MLKKILQQSSWRLWGGFTERSVDRTGEFARSRSHKSRPGERQAGRLYGHDHRNERGSGKVQLPNGKAGSRAL